MIYRINGKRRREQNWKNKRTKQKGRKVAFFTQLFLDTLLQGILLHSAYDWARYHRRARAPPPLFSGMTERAAEVEPSVKWNNKRKPNTVFARRKLRK